MKHATKRFVTFCLAVAMIATLLPATVAKAATKTENVTLYVGEKDDVTNYYDVTKVTSSNKKVVAAARDKENKSHAILTAKKAGTSNVTVATKHGTMKYKVTVKKLSFDVKLSELSECEILITVKNNTKQIFDNAYVTYTLKGADGAVLEKDKKLVDDLLPGKTSYAKIFYNTYDFTVDISQCSGKVTEADRSVSAKYKDCSSKVSITDKVDMDENPGYMTLTLKLKNQISRYVSGRVYIMLYDANDKLIGVRPVAVFLKGSAVNTETVKIDTEYSYPTYDHYKLSARAYSKDY